MLLKGVEKCSKCNRDINWCYQVPQDASGFNIYDCDVIPSKTMRLNPLKSESVNGYRMPINGIVYCPECDEQNEVIIK